MTSRPLPPAGPRRAWGAKPVPLGHASTLGPLVGPEAAFDLAPVVGMPLGGSGSRSGNDLAGLRGRAGAGRRAEVLGAMRRHSQRIVVLSAEGGAGRSALAGGLALAIARYRRWPVAVVDGAQEPTSALPARLGTPKGPTVLDVLPLLGRVTAGTELGPYVRRAFAGQGDRDPSGRPAGGVHLIAAPGPGQRQLAVPEAEMVLRRLNELYPTVLVDCVAGLSQPLHRVALAGAAAVLIVARGRADDLRRAASSVDLLRRSTSLAPVVGAVVAAKPGRWSRAAASAEPVFGAACVAVFRVPWDVSLAESAPVTEVGPAAATSLAEIAATVLSVALPRPEPGGRQR